MSSAVAAADATQGRAATSTSTIDPRVCALALLHGPKQVLVPVMNPLAKLSKLDLALQAVRFLAIEGCLTLSLAIAAVHFLAIAGCLALRIALALFGLLAR